MQTAQDIVAYLLASNGGGAQDGEHSAVRHAVLHGVREVMQCKDWLWHVRSGSFSTTSVSTTGSTTKGSNVINIASTAGFVEGRIVDVSGFDDPVRITEVRRESIVVDQVAKATATSLTVKPQQYYNLPVDLKDIDTLATQTVGTLHTRISPQHWQRLEVNHRGSGEPYYYTVMRSDTHPDRYQIRFVGVPTNPVRVSYTYRVIPKPIKYMGYERLARQGTVSLGKVQTTCATTSGSSTITVASTNGFYVGLNVIVQNFPTATVKILSINPVNNQVVVSANATATGTNVVLRSSMVLVTGTGTDFPQDVSGCMIRFGAAGMEADATGSTVPFLAERRIEDWKSKTALTVSTTNAYQRPDAENNQYDEEPVDFDGGIVSVGPPPTGVVEAQTNYQYVANDLDDINTTLPALTKYAITDIINASPQMYTAILSACEMWYSRVAGKDYGTAAQVFNRDLRIAMENDVVTPMSGQPFGGNSFYATPRTMGWHSNLGEDIA